MERKHRLDGTSVDFACERLLVEPPKRAVLRYVVPEERALEGSSLILPAGTVTIAHYRGERPYCVYHWLAGGRTLAYYCSVSEPPTIAEDIVEYRDLAVDVLLDRAGSATVLDEDELPDDLASPLRAIVSRALGELTGQSRRIVAEIERESRPYV